MPVAKSLALATVLILELTTLVDAAPRSQSGTAVRYQLKAAVAIAQIHVLVSLRYSRTKPTRLLKPTSNRCGRLRLRLGVKR